MKRITVQQFFERHGFMVTDCGNGLSAYSKGDMLVSNGEGGAPQRMADQCMVHRHGELADSHPSVGSLMAKVEAGRTVL